MDNDDVPRGRLFSRREAVTLIGTTGVYLLTGCRDAPASTRSSGGCVARPELTEGPYFVDERLNRSDIRQDPSDGSLRQGALLVLTLNVSHLVAGTCRPLEGAVVDLWHCDAEGVYSDVTDPGFNTVGKKFLRGYQITDAKGDAIFTTIYPGWYDGRTVHIHVKVRSSASAARAYEFTSQLFFEDRFTDQVYARPPYAARGQRTMLNTQDRIFSRGGGEQLILEVTPTPSGYSAAFAIALTNV